MSSLSVRGTRRAGSAALAALLAFGLLLLGLAVPGVASADTRPDAGTPATVSADGLGTVQVNGVVWSMVTVGNTVYATGSFTNARPAGAAAGTSTTPRANLLAFNLTTGALITTFNHTLNGQGRHITASPDGTRVYVAGDFTTVDGVARGHIAAFSTATGALITGFAPTSNAAVYSLGVTNTTVYAGGNFTTAGGQPRTRLAAFSATNGAVNAWAPTANHTVRGIVVAPNGRVVFGGQFSQVNGLPAVALASVNGTNGQDMTPQPYGITNAGDNGGVWSVKYDGINAYATTYGFTVGNIEGVVAFKPNDFALTWMNDCHGDPYDTWSNGTIVYNASHTHDCETSGGFPDPNPRQWKRAIAMTVAPTGILKATTQVPRYGSWEGRPHPTVLNWWPTIPAGTFTGQDQGAWSVTGGGNYVAFAGEFTSVNGVAQQGIVRFATPNVAPNRRGPEISAGNLRPNASSVTAGEVKVTWPQAWDMDNENLTYNVYRGSGTTPVYTVTAKSQWWNTAPMTWTDTGRPAGSTASYRVAVSDPFNNTVTSNQSNTVTVPATTSAYATSVLADAPAQYWRLGETTGSTAYDAVATTNMAEAAGVTRGTAGAVPGDTAITVNGTATGRAATAVTVDSPTNAFTLETWVRTTSTAGGVIAQYSEQSPPTDVGNTDKVLYVDAGGRLSFGLSLRGADRVTRYTTLRSTAPVNDGQWHHIVGTAGPAGTSLYVDGRQVAGNAGLISGNTRVGPGFWMLGSGLLTNAPDVPTSVSLAGAIDELAVYPTTLTSGRVAQHYSAATGTAINASPTGTFTATPNQLAVAVDASGSSDTAPGTIASYAWNWGDATSTPASASATSSHTYAAAGTYTVTLTVTDNGGTTATTTRTLTVTTVPPTNPLPTASFTVTPTGLDVSANGSASSDTAPGTIASYAWAWGDSTTTPAGPASTVSHTYAAGGTYTVTLTVTDDGGATATTTRSVTVAPPANPAPTASFTVTPTGLQVSANGSASSDTAPGTIASYAWAWGDTTTTPAGPASTVSHTYATAGTYTVTLTVTDNGGATATTTRSVTVAPPANPAPTASFTVTPTGLQVSANGSASSDTAPGTIASYAWAWGDSTTTPAGPAITVSHTYAAAGTYTVTLTVTDNGGATGTTTRSVTVAPASTEFARDAFGRTVPAGGWGSADLGGAWTASVGATRLSVTPGVGVMDLPAAGNNTGAYLGAVSQTSADITASVVMSAAPSATGTDVYVSGRRVNGVGEYRFRVRFFPNGTVGLVLSRLQTGVAEAFPGGEVVVPGLTYTPGTTLNVRVQVFGTGTTTARARVWTGATEPTAWQISRTDTTAALQANGAVGLAAYRPSGNTTATAIRFSGFSARPVA